MRPATGGPREVAEEPGTGKLTTRMNDPHAVQISVDGSCYPNEGRKSGYAGVVVYPDDATEHEVVFQGFKESTINRMELSAYNAAMAWVKEQGIGRQYSRVQIFSDSQYVVNSQFSAPFWQKAKWRNAAGRPIENWELWKGFLSAKAKAGIRIDICKVQNKSTPHLKWVDKLAKAAAKSHPRIDRGLVVGKIGRAKIKGTATMFPAASQVLVVRIVGSKTVGPTRENRFVFEVFDESTGAYASKNFAYCTPATGSQLHRQRGFRVRMNDNNRYPQILEVIEEVSLPKAERKKKPTLA
jgi:ribonuclease HI